MSIFWFLFLVVPKSLFSCISTLPPLDSSRYCFVSFSFSFIRPDFSIITSSQLGTTFENSYPPIFETTASSILTLLDLLSTSSTLFIKVQIVLFPTLPNATNSNSQNNPTDPVFKSCALSCQFHPIYWKVIMNYTRLAVHHRDKLSCSSALPVTEHWLPSNVVFGKIWNCQSFSHPKILVILFSDSGKTWLFWLPVCLQLYFVSSCCSYFVPFFQCSPLPNRLPHSRTKMGCQPLLFLNAFKPPGPAGVPTINFKVCFSAHHSLTPSNLSFPLTFYGIIFFLFQIQPSTWDD